jgi:hypothetical protein
VFGKATQIAGDTFGVRGEASGLNGTGVKGLTTSGVGITIGVMGESASNEGTGVFGLVNSPSGLGMRIGVKGEITAGEGIGVLGVAPTNSSATRGVKGITGGNQEAAGVEGICTAETGLTFGVRGETSSSNGIGVEGINTYDGPFTSPPPVGVFAGVNSAVGIGVLAAANDESDDALNIAVLAESSGGIGKAVFASATGTLLPTAIEAMTTSSANGVGVKASGGTGELGFGVIASGHFGVVGEGETGVGGISTTGIGVEGNGTTGIVGIGTDCGVRSEGDAIVNGGAVVNGDFLVTGAKAFRIDHPFDPQNQFLLHYCTEGPQPLNVYGGSVVTDGQGYATIELPDYFEAINRDFRYQLTVIDEGPDFVLAKVAKRIENNQFTIRTSSPAVEVSWEVTAVRNDPYVRAHGAPVEMAKTPDEQGRFLRPELYDQPAEAGAYYYSDTYDLNSYRIDKWRPNVRFFL